MTNDWLATILMTRDIQTAGNTTDTTETKDTNNTCSQPSRYTNPPHLQIYVMFLYARHGLLDQA